jgi:predicted Zn-dependent protease
VVRGRGTNGFGYFTPTLRVRDSNALGSNLRTVSCVFGRRCLHTATSGRAGVQEADRVAAYFGGEVGVAHRHCDRAVTRLAAYAGTFKLPTRGFDDLTKLEIAADAAPKDAQARANLALGYYYGGDAEKAGAAATRTLQLDAKNPVARYILAEIAMHTSDMDKARQLYTGLMAEGNDSYDMRARMAQIAQEDGDTAEVEKQLCAAKKLDPERSHPYQALSQLYKKQGKRAEYLRELETYAFLEQMELAPLKELVLEYGKLSNWAKVKTYGEMATYINPQDLDILMALGRAYNELKDGARALFTFDTALVATPAPRRPALVHLGRAKAFIALGKPKDAKVALDLAARTEPEHAELLQLRARIK